MYHAAHMQHSDQDEDGYRALAAIRRIVRRVSAHSRRVGRETGLSVPKVLVMRAIGSADSEEVTAARVADQTLLSRPAVSNLVEKLVQAGLVARERSATDRRRLQLSLTAAGRQRLVDGPPPLERRFIDRLAALPDDEREQVLSALDRVVDLMDAEDVDAAPVLLSPAKDA